MDPDTLDNWRKIKAHLEMKGAIKNDYYRRACAILRGQKDPGPQFGPKD